MSPTGTTQSKDPEALQSLVGGIQALRVVMARLEHKAATLIWNADPKERGNVIACVMQAAQQFSEALKKCKEAPAPTGQQQPGGGMGPQCPPGSHEEFDVCVPDG
jgi:hypothetical protein